MTVTVTGYGDDLIEVEGSLRAEFYWPTGPAFLGFSNGVVLRVAFGSAWHIEPLAGAGLVQIEQCPEGDEDNYSDKATVAGDVAWVVCGAAWAGVSS